MKTILIIGGTSDIARAVIHKFIHNGYHVIATTRVVEVGELLKQDICMRTQTEHLEFVELDVSKCDTYHAFIEGAFQKEVEISGVLFFTGSMYSEEEYVNHFNKVVETFHVNVVSIIGLIQLCLPHLLKMRHGFISVVSSVAGDRGRCSNMTYGASKAAISEYLEGLRQLYSGKDILIQTVKPGPVATRMTRDMDKLPFLTTPQKVADDIYAGVVRGKDVVYTPFIWYFIMSIMRLLPTFIFKKLKM